MSDPNDYNDDVLRAMNPTDLTRLTRFAQAAAGIDVDGKLGPATQSVIDGFSPIATLSPAPWSGRERGIQWQGQVFCLTAHTTGITIVERAIKGGFDPLALAVRYYQRSTGTHYVNGWDDELIQVASEHQRAHGVSTRAQDKIEARKNGWQLALMAQLGPSDAAAELIARWSIRWRHLAALRPSDLYPGSHYNDLALHCEFLPLPPERRAAEAAGPGLWYTRAQFQSFAALAICVARRNGWIHEPQWWLRRLFGHEDITPISRPGWGPGWLREVPRFSWPLVYTLIEEQLKVER